MRQGKNNRGRGRGRRNGNGSINRNTTLDSNGPDVRLRGNAFQLYEKYISLGNDASAAGERISAEAYYQHADHYFRVHTAILAAGEERRNAQNNGGGDDAKNGAAAAEVKKNGNAEGAETTEKQTAEKTESKKSDSPKTDTDTTDTKDANEQTT